MSLLLPLAFLAAGLPGLVLDLSAPETAVLVGEPVKVVVRWRAAADLPAVSIEDPDFMAGSLQFVVDGAAGPRRYVEYSRARVEMLNEPAPLARGDEFAHAYVLVEGGNATGRTVAPGLLFPSAGSYAVKAVYVPRGAPRVRAESSAVRFSVTAPAGEDAAVLAALRRDPRLRKGGGPIDALKALLKAHPRSRYLRWPRAVLYERRADDLHNRQDPDTAESLWSLDAASLEAFRAARYRAMAEELIDDADWGAFEEERLQLALTYASAGTAPEIAARARADLLGRFPRSPAAESVRALEAERAEAERQDAEAPRPTPAPRRRP